jgi:hypothetical protein
MMSEAVRRNRIFAVGGVTAVAFAAGLASALLGVQAVPRVVGVLGVINGLFLVISPGVVKRNPGFPPEVQIPAEHALRLPMRLLGVTGIFMGLAMLTPNVYMRTSAIFCGAACSMAGAFRFPRRFFAPRGA